MNNIDLSKLTQLELIDLSIRINEELKEYENRDQIKVYNVFIEGVDTKTFFYRNNAVKYLLEYSDFAFLMGNDEYSYPKEISLKESHKCTAAAKQYCEDYPDEVESNSQFEKQ